jgi:hypothetical protein
LIPKFARTQTVKDWVQALLNGLQGTNEAFTDYVNETFYLTSFTGQVVYLEHILNDRFDAALRRIYIEDGNLLPLPPYLYNKIEQRPLDLHNKSEASPHKIYLYNKQEYLTSLDFIVFVPTAILTTELELRIKAIVKRYKLAGKRFAVQPF